MKKRELSYNGWANYETWLVMSSGDIDELVDDYFDAGESPDSVDASDLEDKFMDMVDVPSSGIISAMVNASLSEIDWREIAEHVREALEERIMDNY